ncbi:SusC/RagA family TonB-linked outer membrane protein [Ornithobacterium rhinotracheale]|uniref:SusC/RagA family TonB-linked outer membrane protein n=1 Tax=Ornithobacterium rhinotracheale TaxID=28251 RepID=UPI002158DB27|nr:SusC/RagA family TonB-linked outer membrane protein [Ornithobacterium rhinotracheale]UVD87607.1 SusC/RagA family TonB-linked outer membrane protein [Ornithobacterium rhinotracheale]
MKKILMSAMVCFLSIGGYNSYVYAQQKPLNYEVTVSTPMPELLKALAQKSGEPIEFNEQDLEDIYVSPLDFKGMTVLQALSQLTSNYPIEVVNENGKILVLRDFTRNDLLGLDNKVDLKSVVVTALGIKREEKALSYNTQTINQDEVNTVKSSNFVNSLNGKVAGVTINQGSAGMGSAAKVVMRGAKSIDKSNNALYVVDGVPMLTMIGKQGEGQFASNGSTESTADINPDDIESITVLTGASAAALYGSAAANGAILITTKKGKEGRFSVSISSSTQFSEPLMLPKFQNKYGNDGQVHSWGALLPESYSKYNPKDFFQTPYSYINSFSVSGGTGRNQSYLSAASTNTQGLVPNNKYNRYNFNFRNTTQFLNDKLNIDLAGNYILQDSRNMINQGEYMNPLVSAYLMPRGYTMEKAKVYEQFNPTRKIYEQVWGDFKGTDGLFGGTFSGDYTMQNPYWTAYRNLRDSRRERNILNLGISYEFMKWSNSEKWDISARVKTDNTHYKDTDKRFASTLSTLDMSKNGFFGLSQGVERQNYADVLTNFTKNFTTGLGKMSLMANIGASIQDTRVDGSFYSGPLRVNGIANVFNTFNIDQGADKTKPGQVGWKEQTQSVFGSLELGFRNCLYLTLTGRNDWASQLANSSQSSFFYPSVGLSGIITEMLNPETKAALKPVISYFKVRAAYSSVGSPFSRWLTMPTYEFNEDSKTWKNVAYFPIGDLKPERTNSYEVGISSKWINRKVSLDATYYIADTENQTIKAAISPSTGYDAMFLQTGKVRNSGVELGLGLDLDFSSNVSLNSYFTMSYNKNEILELLEDYTNPVTGQKESRDFLDKFSFGPLVYRLTTGGTLGDIYSQADFRRDGDGNIFVDSGGNLATENFTNGQLKKLGSVLPKYNLGWRNDLKINNFTIGAALNGRIGGVVVSMTEAALDHYGVSQRSAEARDRGGVEVNGVKMSARNYYEVLGKARLPQYYTYSATNFRLQEAYISYHVPKKMINNFVDLTVSITGNNLFMIYCKAPFDPESISTTGNYTQGLDYFMLPTLRSIGLSLKAKF